MLMILEDFVLALLCHSNLMNFIYIYVFLYECVLLDEMSMWIWVVPMLSLLDFLSSYMCIEAFIVHFAYV